MTGSTPSSFCVEQKPDRRAPVWQAHQSPLRRVKFARELSQDAVDIVLMVATRILTISLSMIATVAYAESINRHTWMNSTIDMYKGDPNRHVITNKSPWDTEIVVYGYAHHRNGSCDTNGYYDIYLTKAPVHGRICVKHNDGTGTKMTDGSANPCSQTSAVYSDFYYMPFAGFVGIDSFSYSVQYQNYDPNSVGDVTMEITPPNSRKPKANDPANWKTQSLGLVPMCPVFSS
jgi:hypothetical protein